MVVQLTGEINGADIILTRGEGDRWSAMIPPIPSGVYVVELAAMDDAGNQGYGTYYIVTIDLTSLSVSVRVAHYYGVPLPDSYYAVSAKTGR